MLHAVYLPEDISRKWDARGLREVGAGGGGESRRGADVRAGATTAAATPAAGEAKRPVGPRVARMSAAAAVV